jgi:hypothetical protein
MRSAVPETPRAAVRYERLDHPSMDSNLADVETGFVDIARNSGVTRGGLTAPYSVESVTVDVYAK